MATKIKKLTDEQRFIAAKKLCEMDFQLWFKSLNKQQALTELEEACGFKMSPGAFKSIREEERDNNRLKWFTVQRRPKPSSVKLLKSEEWERLRAAVKSNKQLIEGKSLDEAVAIVSLSIRCNRSTLDGLTSDMHFWRKSK